MLDTVSSPRTRLAALRTAASGLDPLRLHYLEHLSQRCLTAPEPVRHILHSKLEASLTALEQELKTTDLADLRHLEPGGNSESPLLVLNQYLQRAKQATRHPQLPHQLGDTLVSADVADAELASVQRFRQSWSRLAAEQEVGKASERGPEQAGPLNSHRLVLRSLVLLRELSPHYLQCFLSQVQTLQWLESASQHLSPAKAKPARRSRVAK